MIQSFDMKRMAILVLSLALFTAPIGCEKKPKAEPGAEVDKSPAAHAEQRIKTPTLKRGKEAPTEPVSDEVDDTGAKAKAPDISLKKPKKPEKPKKRKEYIPGMPMETPPLPPEAKTEKEVALKPEPPKELEKPAAPTPPEPTPPPAAEEVSKALPGVPGPAPEIEPPPTKKADEEIAFQPKLISGATNTDIVVDASGSMNALYGMTGQTKFDLVRRAVEDVLLGAGEQKGISRNIGVRTFGSEKPWSDNDCEDTNSIAPIAALDIAKITSGLNAVKPQGTSPVAYTLEEASKDFPATITGDRIILLIADGTDTCGQDACEMASKLHQQQYIVQVIGFDVSADDQARLECAASRGGGGFYLARNEAELRSAIDQALNANVPYNLRLNVSAGAVPLPSTITILKSDTAKVISKDKSFGSKIFKLPPGSYDILVEYVDSPEKRKPSKLLKGVEILGTTKVQQNINFELGNVKLSAIDNTNQMVPAHYRIMKAGTNSPIADVDAGAGPITLTLSPGNYDILANQIGEVAERLTLSEKGIAVAAGSSSDLTFRFQKGSLIIHGETTQKQPMPLIYQIFNAGQNELIASGAVGPTGKSIALSPGAYDMIATGQSAQLPVDPRTKITNITIKAGEPADLLVVFEMGELILSAVDENDKPLPAEFKIQDAETGMEIANVKGSGKEAAKVPVPPGKYRIMVYSLRSTVDPKPSVEIKDVQVSAKEPVSKTAKFVLGTIRVRGTDAKEEPVRAQFTLYRSGTEDVIATSKPTDEWVLFEVAPGTYDVKATDVTATSAEKPSVKITDLRIKAGQTISHQSIFTAGKIKIIGRGPNNKIITVKFKIFQYGADRELINGKTGDDWATFEIPPGRYYLEAAYVDPQQDVLLKKWVNVTVGKNEVVEQVLRF